VELLVAIFKSILHISSSYVIIMLSFVLVPVQFYARSKVSALAIVYICHTCLYYWSVTCLMVCAYHPVLI